MSSSAKVTEVTTDAAQKHLPFTEEFWRSKSESRVVAIEANLSKSLEAIDALGVQDTVVRDSLGGINIMTSASLLLVNLRLTALEDAVLNLVPEGEREGLEKVLAVANSVFTNEVNAMVGRLSS